MGSGFGHRERLLPVTRVSETLKDQGFHQAVTGSDPLPVTAPAPRQWDGMRNGRCFALHPTEQWDAMRFEPVFALRPTASPVSQPAFRGCSGGIVGKWRFANGLFVRACCGPTREWDATQFRPAFALRPTNQWDAMRFEPVFALRPTNQWESSGNQWDAMRFEPVFALRPMEQWDATL